MEQEILVSIICNAYNQEEYISQCLDGLVKQKTNFKYEILVHDDASTDRTAAIIKEYCLRFPDIIKPIYQKENQHQKRIPIIFTYQLPRSKGKYIAFCEGDDYWNDDYKLQKQVDLLEEHPEYVLIYTNCSVYNQKMRAFKSKTFTHEIASFEELLLKGNFIGTLTTCFRKEAYEKYYEEVRPQEKGWRAGDYPLWLYLFLNYKAFFLSDFTSVYRELSNSASHYTDPDKQYLFDYNLYTIRTFFSSYSGIQIEAWDEDYELMKRYFKSCLTFYSKKTASTFRYHKKKSVIRKKKLMWAMFYIASYSKIIMKLISKLYIR